MDAIIDDYDLGEFEVYETTYMENGKVYIKVVDRLEEWKDRFREQHK